MDKRSVGFYGKLPIVGDFINRRLPKDFINTLDQWMQQGISVSKEALAEEWLNLYLTSPIWRFAFQAGICGEGAWVGIMMPSVDKVGRYFPLILACQVDERQLALIFTKSNDWFIQLEDLALAGLDENYNLEEFNDAVLALEVPGLNEGFIANSREAQEAVTTNLISDVELNETIAMIDGVMLGGLHSINKQGIRYSLWLDNGSDAAAGSVKIYKGLPTGHDYSRMIA